MDYASDKIIRGSSNLFGGFEITIDIHHYSNLDEIITEWKKQLMTVLKENNFHNLIQSFEKSNFHFHDITFEDVLIQNTIVYICDHC